jgi:hypothetical protein
MEKRNGILLLLIGIVVIVAILYLNYDELSLQFKSCNELLELGNLESNKLDESCIINEDCVLSYGRCVNKNTGIKRYELIRKIIDSKCVYNRMEGREPFGCACLNKVCTSI